MLKKLNHFFNTLLEQKDETKNIQRPLELACAVLLCEIMRADGHLSPAEEQQLLNILQQKFSLSRQQANELLVNACSLSEDATDFYQFTSQLNQTYSRNQRVEMVNLLWTIAYADGQLASIEEHIIRKISDLLHLRHSEYIATKINVQAKQVHNK